MRLTAKQREILAEVYFCFGADSFNPTKPDWREHTAAGNTFLFPWGPGEIHPRTLRALTERGWLERIPRPVRSHLAAMAVKTHRLSVPALAIFATDDRPFSERSADSATWRGYTKRLDEERAIACAPPATLGEYR